MKKEIFFTFLPDDGYFFSSPPSCRHTGNAITHEDEKRALMHQWMAQNSLGHRFACWIAQDRALWHYPNSALCTAHPRLAAWCRERCGSPVRVVFGPGLSYIAWQPMGSHMCREEAPKSAKELINSAHTLYTSIRLVALGVQDAYIIIWENGVMRWDLKDQYAALDIILWKCDGEDVSFIAINPNRAGDYFVYFDKTKLAMFQVSEAFGKDMDEVLRAEGIRSQAIVRRKETKSTPQSYANPPAMPAAAQSSGFLKGIAKSVGVGANIVAIGATLAGLASCTVM